MTRPEPMHWSEEESGLTYELQRLAGSLPETFAIRAVLDEARLPSDGALQADTVRAVLAAMPVPLYTTDAEGRLTFFNEAAAAIWGREPALGAERWCGADRILTPAGEPIPIEQSPMAITIRERREVRGIEAVIERPDGSRVPFLPFPTLLRDGAGAVVGGLNLLIDISERRVVEEALRESEAHHRHALELNPQMPWASDAEGRITDYSDRWVAFTGRSRKDLEEYGYLDLVAAEDQQRLIEEISASAVSGQPFDIRFRMRHHDGTYRWMHSRAYPRRDGSGAIIRWYGSTEDIHERTLAEERLRAAEERYRLAGHATNDVVWDFDVAEGRIKWNAALATRFGYSEEETGLDWWVERVHPADRARAEAEFGEALAGEEARWQCEYRFLCADGSFAYVLDRGFMIRDEAGRVRRALGAMLDVSESRAAEEKLRTSEERFRLAVAATGLGISDYNVRTGEEHWSAELREILGIAPDAPVGEETWLAVLHPEYREQAAAHLAEARQGRFEHRYRGTYRISRATDGADRWVTTEGYVLRDDAGLISRVIVTARDVTAEKIAQQKIRWVANNDALTRLPNRSLFQTRLNEALAGSGSGEPSAALLLVDLDDFKEINDTFGHQAGDAVLVAFARRLGRAAPEGATVARLGGDEFALILPGANADIAMAVAEQVQAGLARPVAVEGRFIDIKASVGAAIFPTDAETSSDLMKSADIALYAAKTRPSGRGVMLFRGEMRADLQRHVSMLRQARRAAERDWIVPHYQPKVMLHSGAVVGYEALLRWQHPSGGLQTPASIAPAFEDVELSAMLGDRMIHCVLRDIAGWLDAGHRPGRVAINASAAEFRRGGFAERLLRKIDAAGVPAACIELEITESAFLGNKAEHVLSDLATVRRAGIRVALDDFGTGYSSLSHLRLFPVDTIKIDQSFVCGLGALKSETAIVDAVLGLGRALGMETVAEGIETKRQAEWLRSKGCMMGQGYLFGRAISAEEVMEQLRAG